MDSIECSVCLISKLGVTLGSECYNHNRQCRHTFSFPPSEDDVKKDYSVPKDCGMLAGVCGVPLSGWTLGVTGTCVDAPAAVRFGKTKFSGFIMEVCVC